MKREIILFAFIAALIMSCDTGIKDDSDSDSIGVCITRGYSNSLLPTTASDDQITSLALYCCDAGVVRVVYTNLSTSLENIQIPLFGLTTTSTIYAIANGDLCPALAEIGKGSSEKLLRELTSNDDQENRTRLIMTGYTVVGESKMLHIDLRRNMARFDLRIATEASIEVHSITVNGLPTESLLFTAETEPIPSNTSGTINQVFSPVMTESRERLFYTLPLPAESTAAVATIVASYKGAKAGIDVPLSEIRRNFKYTLSLVSNNGSLTATVAVSDMATGEEVIPDKVDVPIWIDHEQTVLSSDVIMTSDRLTFPCEGGNATLFLTGDFDKQLKLVSNHSIADFEITPNRDSSKREVNYTIKVGEQWRQGNDNPAVMLSFGRIDEMNPAKWDRIVVVAVNYAPFEVVTFGGLDWLAVNGIGHDWQLYPLLREGDTPRATFNLPSDWARYTGKLYQWGPRQGTFARATWEWIRDQSYQTLPNCNGPILNNATRWTGNNLPCPDGWRLPTYEEYQTIWPQHGTTIPQDGTSKEYTTSTGATYRAVIEQFGGSYYVRLDNGATYLNARSLIITDGTHELLFPIAGYRTANGTFLYKWIEGLGANLGTEVYYWCQDKVNSAAVAVGINNGVVHNSTANKGENNWYNIRCVRSAKRK